MAYYNPITLGELAKERQRTLQHEADMWRLARLAQASQPRLNVLAAFRSRIARLIPAQRPYPAYRSARPEKETKPVTSQC